MRLVLRIVINAVALWLTAQLLPSIEIGGNLVGLFIVAIIFGIVNALIKPIVALFSLPLTVMTLGLFTLVINAAMLLLTSALSRAVGLAFVVEGFWPAFWGALIVSIVSFVVTLLIREDD